jgi:hypothetical protein
VPAQIRPELGHEDHVAARGRRLQTRALAGARGLEADLDDAGLEVDVVPRQPEQLADPQAREDRGRDRQAVGILGDVEQQPDLLAVEEALAVLAGLRALRRQQRVGRVPGQSVVRVS